MEAAAIPTVREGLRRMTLEEAEALAAFALDADTAEDVERALTERLAPRLMDILICEVAEV